MKQREAGKLGGWEAGKLGSWEAGKLGSWEAGKLKAESSKQAGWVRRGNGEEGRVE